MDDMIRDHARDSSGVTFSIGARVLVDSRYEATVKQAFPEGSSSYSFPHYKLDMKHVTRTSPCT